MSKENIKKYEFQKGTSGNPKGRPKGSRNRSTIAREWLNLLEDTDNPITGGKEKLCQEDLMTLALIKKAKEGDTNAYKALMDSGYGAPIQQVDQTVVDKTPSKLKWRKSEK